MNLRRGLILSFLAVLLWRAVAFATTTSLGSIVVGAGLALSTVTISLDLTHANAWSGTQTFAGVYGTMDTTTCASTDSGACTLSAVDCGKTVESLYTSGTTTVTVPSTMAVAGETCNFYLETTTANKATLSGSGLTVESANSYTGTAAIAWAGISVQVKTIGATTYAVITGGTGS